MQRIKDYRKYIIMLASALPIYFLFSQITIFGDDAANKGNVAQFSTLKSLSLYVWHQYFTWSSRIIVNFVMYFVESKNIQTFAIITGLLFVVLIVSMSRIFNRENDFPVDIAIIFIMYCIPFVSLVTASWIATTTTYLWPSIMAVYSVTSLFVREKNYVSLLRIPFLVLATLYAANNEQVLIVLFCIFSFETFYHRFSFDKRGICIYLQELMIFLDAALIILSPGNKVRNIADTRHFFPDFSKLSIFNKLDMGIMSTGQHFIYGFNFSIIILFAMLSIYYYCLPKSKFRRMHLFVSLGNLILLFVLSSIFFISYRYGRLRRLFYFPKEGLLKSPQPIAFVLLLICLNFVVFISLVYSISMFKNFKDNRIIYEIFIAGLLSRLAVSSSATQYASSSRTFFTFEFCLLVITLFVCIQLVNIRNTATSKIPILILPMAFGTINVIMLSLALDPQNHFISQNLFLWLGIFYN